MGSDRLNEFKILLDKYNGKKGRHGFYNFEKIFNVKAENFNFYFSFFRIWELGIGCIFSILKNRKKITLTLCKVHI